MAFSWLINGGDSNTNHLQVMGADPPSLGRIF